MTAAERDAVRLIRDLNVRIAELERENARLQGMARKYLAGRRKAAKEGRLLHGLLVANGIEVKR